MGYIGNPLDPWGADDEHRAYRVAFEAFAASGAYDVLAIVHDSPFRDLPCEVDVARDVSTRADRGDRATGRTSCPSTSRSPRATSASR